MAVINDRNFENAICKIQGNAEADLTSAEKAAVQIFKILTVPANPAAAAAQPPQVSFFNKSHTESQQLKKARAEKSAYLSTEHVSSTSNVCERLFSVARLVMSHLRKNMDPGTLNMILFLKANKALWTDKSIIDEIIADFTANGDSDD